MNIRAKSDEYSVLAAAEAGEGEHQQVYTPPTLYIQALFATAFAEAWFDRHFDFLKHYDETFGKGCYGHTLRLYPERVYVMHRDLATLENGGWKDHPAFAKYLAKVGEIVTIPDEEKKDGGKMFFDRTTKVFLDTIRSRFNDKIASKVRMLEREEQVAQLLKKLDSVVKLPSQNKSKHNHYQMRKCQYPIEQDLLSVCGRNNNMQQITGTHHTTTAAAAAAGTAGPAIGAT